MRRTLLSVCVLQAFSPLSWAEVEPLEKAAIELQTTSITGAPTTLPMP